MSLLNSAVKAPKNYFAVCKKCRKPCQFKVIEASTSIVLPFLKYRKNYVAVCESCNTVYSISESVGNNLLLGKGTLSEYDMKEKSVK